jgi:hypothetical protein
LRQNFASRPFELQPAMTTKLFDFLNNAPIKLNGAQLYKIRREHTKLASP